MVGRALVGVYAFIGPCKSLAPSPPAALQAQHVWRKSLLQAGSARSQGVNACEQWMSLSAAQVSAALHLTMRRTGHAEDWPAPASVVRFEARRMPRRRGRLARSRPPPGSARTGPATSRPSPAGLPCSGAAEPLAPAPAPAPAWHDHADGDMIHVLWNELPGWKFFTTPCGAGHCHLTFKHQSPS